MKKTEIRSGLLLAILLSCFFGPARNATIAQSGWYTVESGTTVTLNGISWSWPASGGLSSYPGLLRVVGDSGTFIQSGDAGDTWTSPAIVPTGANLNAVDFSFTDTGYVVGDGGTLFRVLRTGDQYQFSLPSSVPTTRNLNCVTSIPLTVSGFAAGDSGTILRTTTRGQTWIAHNSGTTLNINSIRMATVSRIFACGDSGLILRSQSSGNWVTIPAGPGFSTNFNDITVAGSLGDTAWVVGENGTILRSRNAASPTPAWFLMQSGVTVTLRNIIYNQGTMWVVGDSGTILHSTNSGDTWTTQESGTTENLRDILFPYGGHGYIVGETGTILRTTTGGGYRPLSASPSPLGFGPVIVGSTRRGILTARNSSDLPIDITLAGSTNPTFSVTPAAATIPANGNLAFTVEFTPAAKVTDTSTIVFKVDSGAQELRVAASGSGVDSLGPSSWSWLNPSTQGNPLGDLGFFDAQHGIAVGEAGTIIRTDDSGVTWMNTHHPVEIKTSFIALDILDAQEAIAVGEYGLILSTTDGGDTWSVPAGPVPAERLVSVSFFGTDTGYVVGSSETPFYPTLPSMPPYFPSSGSIYRTTDGGSTWENQVPSSPGSTIEIVNNVPLDIAAVTSDVAVAVGLVYSGGAVGTIFRTTDGGARWSKIFPGTGPLRAVTFIDELRGIAVGDGGGILRTTDGGATWSPVSSPTGSDLYSVAFSGESDGIAFGVYGDCLTTTDGGLTWVLRPAPPVSFWRAVAFPGPDIAIGIAFETYDGSTAPPPTYFGVQQALHRSTDRGATWEKITGSVETHSLRSVSFKDAVNGVAVSERGGILKTTDGGATWRLLTEGSLLAYVRHPLTSVCYFPPDNIVVAGMNGLVLYSPDGGTSWVEQSSGTTATLHAVAFDGPDAGYIVGANGTILRTTDTGTHWMSQTTSYRNELRGVDLFDPAGAVVVGSSGIILRTSDAGRSWDVEAGGTDQTLYDVSLAGISGVAVGDAGAIAHTTDAGDTWQPAISGTTALLLGTFLSGSGTGTAVGDGGTILRTNDAGATWTISPSGTNIMLYDVAFVDDLVGTVVGGAGVMLRTTTGGMQSNVVTDIPAAAVPAAYRLEQNYPNPFNPMTTIRYRLPAESRVILKIYDLLGRVVATLVDGFRPAGEQSVIWDAKGVASGVYVYRLEAMAPGSSGGGFTRDIRMVLVR